MSGNPSRGRRMSAVPIDRTSGRSRRAVAWRCILIALCACAVAAAGCTRKEKDGAGQDAGATPPVPASAYGILDHFDVGPGVYVRSLAIEPKTRALWVGTSVGVLEIDLDTHAMRNTFTRDQGLANEYVFAIGLDGLGQKWFGTNAGGMSRYKDGDWKTYFPMHGLADFWVYAFANQGDDQLWIGTWAGANRLTLSTGEFKTYVKELVNEWVYAIAVDSKQRVWFGTEGGVSMFDGAQWRAWTHDDGIGMPNAEQLPPSANTGLGTRSRHDLGVMRGGQATYNPSYVFSLVAAPDDTIWVGTWGGGVSRFDGQSWKSLGVREGLAGSIVYSIAREASGVLWFGTNAGVSRYDGDTWRTFGRHDGLANLDTYAIAVDEVRHDVWIGTLSGVTRIGVAPPNESRKGSQ